MTVPFIFFAGESAGVAEDLNANFAYLLNLIQQAVTLASAQGVASGSSSCRGQGKSLAQGNGTANGNGVAFARSTTLNSAEMIGTATGTAIATATGGALDSGVGTATGTNSAAVFFSDAGAAATATATGTSTATAEGVDTISRQASASGTSTATGNGVYQFSTRATALGTSTAPAKSPLQSETVEGYVLTLSTQTIYASQTPGQTAGTNFDTFQISANPGNILVNGTQDTSPGSVNIVELYYHNHTVYRQNVDNIWGTWTSADTWATVANPLAAAPVESPTATSVTATNQTINASKTSGSIANPVTTVDTWTLSAVPGLAVHNGSNVGSPTNITQLYYSNHSVYASVSGTWSQWTGESAGVGGSFVSASSPILSTKAIYVNPILPQNTNQTIPMSGTLQGYNNSATAVNLIRNSSASGVASGTPGILPNNWAALNLAGLTMSVQAGSGGTDATTNTPYIDVLLTGTPTSTTASFQLDSIGAIIGSADGATSNPFTFYASLGLMGGSNLTNVTLGGSVNLDCYVAGLWYNDKATNSNTALTTTPRLLTTTVNTPTPYITRGVGSFTDGSGNVYTVTSAGVAMEAVGGTNPTAMFAGSGTRALELYNNVVYGQDNTSLAWSTWSGAPATGKWTPSAAPPTPVVTLLPYVQLFFTNTTTPVNAIFRIANVQVQAGPNVLAFQSTPLASSAPPTLQYQDNVTTGTWLALPSSTNVTNSTFSFVHPPITGVNASETVNVRDSVTTTVVGTSNQFSVSTAGTVTILSITTSPASPISLGNPVSGTIVCTVTVATAPGTFSGTVTSSDTTNFNTALVGGVWTVTTSKVLAAGPYSFTLTATQNGAAGSGMQTSVALTVTAESAPGTSYNSASGTIVAPQVAGQLNASSFWTWSMMGTAGAYTVGLNGVSQSVTSNVVQIYMMGHTFFQKNSAGNWYSFTGSVVQPITATSTTGANWPAVGDPTPLITLTTTNFAPIPIAKANFSESIPSGGGTEVTCTAGGSNNAISLALGGTYGTSFSFTQSTGDIGAGTRTGTISAATAPLWTVSGFALPANGGPNADGKYPITITATIL